MTYEQEEWAEKGERVLRTAELRIFGQLQFWGPNFWAAPAPDALTFGATPVLDAQTFVRLWSGCIIFWMAPVGLGALTFGRFWLWMHYSFGRHWRAKHFLIWVNSRHSTNVFSVKIALTYNKLTFS